MAPKPKKVKKTKQQLEEERKQAEEAARLAEEERLRLEAEEQARKAAEEEKRQELIQLQTEREDARLASERQQLEPTFADLENRCAQVRKLQQQAEDWERYLLCTPLPDVRDAAGVHAYFAEAATRQHKDIASVLHTCQEYYTLIRQCQQVHLAALQKGDTDLQQQCQKCVQQWQTVLEDAIDAHTASILQNPEEYQDEAGGMQVCSQTSMLKYGLWVNTSKNPRLKTVDFPKLGISLEIPKLIALASVALRVQWRECDEHLEQCTTDFMAVGGVLHLDILSLPVPSNKANGWTLRPVTNDSLVIHRLAYPTPPAGADPETWVPEEEPQPIGISISLPQGSILPSTNLQAAFWDRKHSLWSTADMSSVTISDDSGVVAFQSKAIGCLAVVQKRTGLLPYQGWHVRPAGGRSGAQAMVSLQTGNTDISTTFKVTKEGIELVEPRLPRLAGVRGRSFAAPVLLFELMQRGLYLTPQAKDSGPADLALKEANVATAMCEDIALLGSTHLMKHSRWNRHVGPQVCLCRISQVNDWEEGGRIEVRHVDRIFTKEQPSGPHQVQALMRRGLKGVALTDALDTRASCPALPQYGSPEYDNTFLDRLHASIPALLSASAAQDRQEAAEAVPANLEESNTVDAASSAASTAENPAATASVVDSTMLHDVEPMFMRNLAELLDGLGVFSC
ncbi:hypothetical protein WJX79_002717 [Trebouxia sp. C0005]